MIKIFVALSVLFTKAKGIMQSGVSLQKSGSSLSNAGARAPSYDGQFGPAIQAMGSEANAKALLLAAGFTDLGFRLERKANQFQSVDNASLLANLEARAKVNEWFLKHSVLARFAGIFGIWFLSDERWKRLLALVRISDLSYLKYFLILAPAAIVQWYGKTYNPAAQAPAGQKPKQNESSSPESQPIKLVDTKPLKGEQCVDYAKRRRNVNISGNAEDWADNARRSYRVDTQPSEGAIMVFKPDGTMKAEGSNVNVPGVVYENWNHNFLADKTYGHVAIVESVFKNSNGTYTIVITHANGGTSPRSLIISPDKLRGVEFIHERL